MLNVFNEDAMGRRLPIATKAHTGARPMTLKIVKNSRGRKTTIRLVGELKSEHIDLIKAEMKDHRSQMAFDLSEVSLVDVNIVRFLGSCQTQGIELLHCSRYVREWITRERQVQR
jgi:hypothetical protein